MTPSKYQTAIYKAFQLTKRDINISAVAGSGKTTTLLELLKFVPRGMKTLFLAFNKSIVEELKSRNENKEATIMTIHSCGWGAIMIRYGSRAKMNPNKTIAKTEIVLEQNKIPAKRYSYFFYVIPKLLDLMRCNMTENTLEAIRELAMYYDVDIDDEDIPLVQRAFKLVVGDKSQFDFMDMIYVPVTDPSVRLKKYDYVFCDESQDFSICQHEFIKRCINRRGRLITVGDRNQCQPVGSMVVMAGGNIKDISEIMVGDKVVSYDKNSGGFTGFSSVWSSLKYAKKVEEICKSKYCGNLICLKTENNISKYTPNHRCIVKLDESEYYTGYFVYLMNRITDNGIDWRIGKTKIFNNNGGSFGVRTRLLNENGDNVWLLRCCRNDSDAKIWEEIYSTKYGITQKCFTTGGNDNKTFGDNKNLNFMFAVVRRYVNERVERLFKDLNLDISLPFLTKYDTNKHFSKFHMFECYACNVNRISKVLNVMCFENGQKIWKKFDSFLEKYNGYVYSLKIQDTELYVSDEILTHNSIYGFAGADANSYDKLASINGQAIRLPLSVSYRCAKAIVLEAQRYVPSISYAPNAEEGKVDINSLTTIREGDWILCRNLKPLIQAYLWLIKNKIKCKIRGKDIAENIVNLIRKTGAKTLDGLMNALEIERNKLLDKLTKKGVRKPSLHPKMEVLEQKQEVIAFLSDEVTSVDGLIKLLEGIFSDDTDGILLSTIHKSKGLENERIFFICPELIPSKYATQDWQIEQEYHLKYVAITRAKKELIYVPQNVFDNDLMSNVTIDK